MGINFQITPKLSVEDGINAVRKVFNHCWFHKTNCKEGLRALKHYKKEFDDARNVWKNKPYHNWASHGADAIRYLAVNSEKYLREEFIDKPRSEFGNEPEIKTRFRY